MDMTRAVSSGSVSEGNCGLLSGISALYSEYCIRVAFVIYVHGFGNPHPRLARGFFAYAEFCADDVEIETEP